MFEVFDKEDINFLKKYEQSFLDAKDKVQDTGAKYLVNMPQYKIQDSEFILDLLSNYPEIYPDWIRCDKFSYVFRFQPDTHTMLPHIDIDAESAKRLKGKAKRVLIYANPIWKDEWKGGTYFAPYEQFKVSKRHVAIVKKEKFAAEASLVQNKPGRVVVFDPDEIHAPQEFSGNDVQRLVFAALIIHPDHVDLIDRLEGPNNENGEAVTKLT